VFVDASPLDVAPLLLLLEPPLLEELLVLLEPLFVASSPYELHASTMKLVVASHAAAPTLARARLVAHARRRPSRSKTRSLGLRSRARTIRRV